MKQNLQKRVGSFLIQIGKWLSPSLMNRNYKDYQTPQLVVLICWENLGDLVLFSAVIREFKLNFPDSRLLVVAQRENKELMLGCPYVSKWIWIKGHNKPKAGMGHGKQTKYWYKLVITYLLLLIHGKKRIDYLLGPDWLLVNNTDQFTKNILFQKSNRDLTKLSSNTNMRANLFNDKSHQVTRMLSILSMFGLKVSSDEIENWIQPKNPSLRQGFTQKLPKDSNQILISLGAGQFRRNWPIEKISSLVDSFQISHPTHTVILLGPKSMMSKEIDNTFSNLRNVINLVGKTSLQEVVFLMKNSKLLVSNDSGLVHIGASMKLPCVVISSHPLNGDLWHLHAPNRYHPWKTKYLVLQPSKLLGDCTGSCIADRPHCISSIPVTDVHKACLQLLNPHF